MNLCIGACGWLLLLPLAAAAQENADGRENNDSQAAIAAIRAAGGRVMKIAANTEDQEVQFYLSGQEVTDEALRHVPNVPRVVWLNLRGTKVTDDGLEPLSRLTGLTRLHLEKTNIGDEGLKHLAGLTELEYLNLYGTRVTDAGLEHLRGLNKLKKLFLWQTQVTDEGVAKLQEALPETEIVRGLDLAPVEKPAPAAEGQDQAG